ncbi:MAG: TonB family protein [Candidatus Aminicenantes bacterium]|nr:TonB family protein [Candidatus Aminicenantes bacterium]
MTKGGILAFSLALHAVVLYFALTLRIDVKILNFNEKRTNVVLVPLPRIKFTASPSGESARNPDASAEVAAAKPGMPARPLTEEERRRAEAAAGTGNPTGGGEGVPPGGTAGEMSGGTDREKDDSLTSGFSLVYPADAMLNLSKYAQVPEDDWLRPLRELTKPRPSFSRYLHPPAGTREPAMPGSGGKGIPGGTGTPKAPPAGVVAAFVPENVKTFDISGWATDVLNAVQRNWTLGVEAWSAEWSGRVTVTILVMKNGELNGIDVSASSNIALLDASALRAIDRSGPWPALPSDFPDLSLEIQLVFQYGL